MRTWPVDGVGVAAFVERVSALSRPAEACGVNVHADIVVGFCDAICLI